MSRSLRRMTYLSLAIAFAVIILLLATGCGSVQEGINNAGGVRDRVCTEAESAMAEAEAQGLNENNSQNYANVKARYERLCQ